MKKFKVLFFFLLMILGWWCGNNQSSTSQSSSTSGSKNLENVVLPIQDHFKFVFDELIEILMKSKGWDLSSIFDEQESLEDEDDVVYAYFCSKIGNEQINQKIKNWIHKDENKKSFLSYFTQQADVLKLDLIKQELADINTQASDNLKRYVCYFGLALSCNLENEEMTRCLKFILEIKEEGEPFILLLKLMLLELSKDHCVISKIVKEYFSGKFDDYLILLWKDSEIPLNFKLKLAEVLKKLEPTLWDEKGKDWVKAAFQDYQEFFQIEPFSVNLINQDLLNAQKEWISEELTPKIIEFRLWQKWRSEKMLESIFVQIFSKDHLEILKNYIQNQNELEKNLEEIFLFFHKDLRPVVEQWVRRLKQDLEQTSDDEKENILILALFSPSVCEITFGF